MPEAFRGGDPRHMPAGRSPGHSDGKPDMLAAALRYAAQGIDVIPLIPRGKIPLTEHGKDDATTDPEVIRDWWAMNPAANIGIRPAEGLLVLDVDPRSGGHPDALGVLPATWEARTGSGGWHFWFRYAGQAKGKLAGCTGVDIKTHKGYLVAAPSVHPCGDRYAWANDAPIAKLPEHLVNRVRALPVPLTLPTRTEPPKDGKGLANFVLSQQEGGRNNALFWAACQAMTDEKPEETLAGVVEAAKQIGLTDWEIENTLRSAQRTARR